MMLQYLVPWTHSFSIRQQDDSPLTSVHRRINRLLGGFFQDFDIQPPEAIQFQFRPRIEATETETEVKVVAELPGIDRNDIEVTLQENTLTISGRKKSEQEQKSEGEVHHQGSLESFRRVIGLPDNLDTDKTSAELDNGLLTIKLAKLPEAKPEVKKIEVKSK